MKWGMLVLAMAACGSPHVEAAPASAEHAPSIEVHPIAHDQILRHQGRGRRRGDPGTDRSCVCARVER